MSARISPLHAAVLVGLAACGGPREEGAVASSVAEERNATAAGDYRPPPDLTQVDVCALLPAAEIPERFGKVIEGPTSSRDGKGWPRCSYVLAPNTGLIVELMESSYYDMNRGAWDRTGTRDVPGVGEKAFLYVAVKVTTRKLDLAEESAKVVLGKL